MSNCIRLTDGGSIEVRLPSDPDCNLCSSRDREPKDARDIIFSNRHGQNSFVLSLCARHRLDLVMALLVGQTMEVPNGTFSTG